MNLNKQQLIQIKNEIHNCRLDLEEIEHGHVHEARKPTHKPNKNMGEGKASKAEIDYRTDLITPFQEPHAKIKKIIHGPGTEEQKKKEIDSTIQDFKKTDFKPIINTHIYDINQTAIDWANKELQRIEDEKKKETLHPTIHEAQGNKYQPNQAETLSPLIIQQYGNMGNILDGLENDIDQAWQRCAIIKKTRPKHQCPFDDYLDESFARAENRADGMGWYGWFKANETGLLATFMMGSVVLGSLEADWTPCEITGDCPTPGPVCEECWALYDENPYLITNWPEEPHFGCRCSMQNVRLASS